MLNADAYVRVFKFYFAKTVKAKYINFLTSDFSAFVLSVRVRIEGGKGWKRLQGKVFYVSILAERLPE